MSNAAKIERIGRMRFDLDTLLKSARPDDMSIRLLVPGVLESLNEIMEDLHDGIPADKDRSVYEDHLTAESIFGGETRRGLVRLTYGIQIDVLLRPAEAREFAGTVFEAAESAESEEFLMKWLADTVGVNPDSTPGVLKDWREFRERTRKQDDAKDN